MSSRRRAMLAGLVAVVAAAAFAPALSAGFCWDDEGVVVGNDHLRDIGWMFIPRFGHWQPLTLMSYALDSLLWGMRPLGYHLTNILLHAAGAVVVLFVLAEAMRAAGADPRAGRTWIAAAAGAALWAVHPLRVESVAWVTERRDVLSGVFWAGALLAYFRAQRDAARGRWLAASVALTALSLMSKAWAMTMPIVLLVVDAYPLRRLGREPLARILAEKIPYAVLGIAAAVLALVAQRGTGAMPGIGEFTVAQRVAQAGHGLAFYPMKTLAPVGLSPLYAIDRELDPLAARYVLSWVAVAAVTISALALRRRWPGLTAAWAAYIVIVSPVLGLAQVGPQAVADRYSYLSCVPLAVLAAAVVVRFGVPALCVAGAAIGAFGVQAALQSRVWHDSITLWNCAVSRDPRNAVARLNRAEARRERGDHDGAAQDLDAALEINERFAEAWGARGALRLERSDFAAALADLDRSVALGTSARHVVLTNRARAKRELGDRAGALTDLDAAIAAEPSFVLARRIRGAERMAGGDPRGAVEDYTVVLAARPDAEARMQRGVARFQTGDARGALADLDEAVRLRPGWADALVNRGTVRRQCGDRDGAVSDYERALGAAPPGWPSRAAVEGALAELRRRTP